MGCRTSGVKGADVPAGGGRVCGCGFAAGCCHGCAAVAEPLERETVVLVGQRLCGLAATTGLSVILHRTHVRK